ncbi:MAG: efflux transporter periplasmic adaptor subunit, partial [Muribaculaceae bacterium]|nr:efflux transporter periplasmic adaptor subunit [Muribaculaceae bacterium]
KEGVLKSGMYVKVHLPVEVSPEAILVKDAAVSTDQRGKYVYTVNDKNQVVYSAINVGDIYNDSLRVVVSGLTAQDKYVTEALLKVKPGMTVNPEVVK